MRYEKLARGGILAPKPFGAEIQLRPVNGNKRRGKIEQNLAAAIINTFKYIFLNRGRSDGVQAPLQLQNGHIALFLFLKI